MLRVRELRKRFGKAVALNSVSFEIDQSTIHGLIGPNGSGKTTLFNLATGFLSPTSGRVIFEGKEITDRAPHVISRLGIARTFQNGSNFGNLTVRENLVMASRNRIETSWLPRLLHLGAARSEEAAHGKLADAILERFAMQEFADALAADLPGGTQKILGVAIAYATGPRLLMLDEPLAGLNSGEKLKLMQIIRGLREDSLTIVLIEHDMKAIMQTCDRITVLCYGDLIAEGTPDEIRQNPATIQAYLGEEAA